MNAPKIFLDSDGVMADFEGGFKEQFGLEFHSTNASKAWSLIRKNPDFYAKLPILKGAEEIWRALEGRELSILTGCPSSGYDDAEKAKREWWATNFGTDVDVITCLSKDKALHMRSKGDILFDDHKRNIDSWSSSGGVGYLHQHPDLTVFFINNL
jgi:5'-nucleotidase